MQDILATSEFSARSSSGDLSPRSEWKVSLGDLVPFSRYIAASSLAAMASYKQQQSAQYRAMYTPVFPVMELRVCLYALVCTYILRIHAYRS